MNQTTAENYLFIYLIDVYSLRIWSIYYVTDIFNKLDKYSVSKIVTRILTKFLTKEILDLISIPENKSSTTRIHV